MIGGKLFDGVSLLSLGLRAFVRKDICVLCEKPIDLALKNADIAAAFSSLARQ